MLLVNFKTELTERLEEGTLCKDCNFLARDQDGNHYFVTSFEFIEAIERGDDHNILRLNIRTLDQHYAAILAKEYSK